jgi:hypothetical protein
VSDGGVGCRVQHLIEELGETGPRHFAVAIQIRVPPELLRGRQVGVEVEWIGDLAHKISRYATISNIWPVSGVRGRRPAGLPASRCS